MHSATWGFFHSKESPNAHGKKDAASFCSIIPISAALVYRSLLFTRAPLHPNTPSSHFISVDRLPLNYFHARFPNVFEIGVGGGGRYRYRLKRYLLHGNSEISTKAFARLLRLISKRLFVEHRDRDPIGWIHDSFSTKQIVEGANCRREAEDGEEGQWVDGEDKSRLAFQAGFQYHEWTFKQALSPSPSHQSFSSPFLPQKAIHPWGFFDLASTSCVKFFLEEGALTGKGHSFQKKKKNTRIPSREIILVSRDSRGR